MTLLKLFLNTLGGLILIFIWSRFVNLQDIFETLKTVDLISLVPIFFFMLCSPIIRAIRLKVFLKPVKVILLKDLIFLTGLGLLLNYFVPIRAGEIAKGIYLNNKYNISLSKSV